MIKIYQCQTNGLIKIVGFIIIFSACVFGCASSGLDKHTNIKSIADNVIALKTNINKDNDLLEKMDKETAEEFKYSALKNMDLSEITRVQRNQFMDFLNYKFYKNQKIIIAVFFYQDKNTFPSDFVPEEIKPYCGLNNNCDCYLWQDNEGLASGECLLNVKNGRYDHNYFRIQFSKLNFLESRLALTLINAIESKAYSDDSIFGQVDFYGCSYEINYGAFREALMPTPDTKPYNPKNSIGSVKFINLGNFSIDSEFIVTSIATGRVWKLDFLSFKRGLEKVNSLKRCDLFD